MGIPLYYSLHILFRAGLDGMPHLDLREMVQAFSCIVNIDGLGDMLFLHKFSESCGILGSRQGPSPRDRGTHSLKWSLVKKLALRMFGTSLKRSMCEL
jgi:hypothetical protein